MEDLRHLFARHQIAAVHREFGESLALLDRYREALSTHVTDEEVWLLPLLRRTRSAPGRTTEAFQSDHRRLQAMLESIRTALTGLRDAPSVVKLIAFLEREHRYKHLFETHSEREHNLLFPLLDQLSSSRERDRVLARCHLREGSISRRRP